MNRLGDHFGISDCRGVKRRSAPRHIERHSSEVDDAAVAAVAAQIVRRSHEDAVNRARLDAKRTKHALRVVDRVPSNLESFSAFDPLFANVDTVDRAGFGALIARDARREIKSVKAAITSFHWNRQFWVFEVFRKRFAIRPVSLDPSAKRYPQAMRNGVDSIDDIAHPGPHSLYFIYH